MPVNYQQIQQQVRDKAKSAPSRQAKLNERAEKARSLLEHYAADLAALQDKVSRAALSDKGLRCSVPLAEPLNHHHSAGQPEVYPVLLAADGSQVNPNRHDAVEFGLVNIGIIRLIPGQALTPVETTSSELILYDDDDSGQPLTEEYVALLRDFQEREVHAQTGGNEPQPVLTLTRRAAGVVPRAQRRPALR